MNSASKVLTRVRGVILPTVQSLKASRNSSFSTVIPTSATSDLFDDIVRKRSFARSFDKDKPVNQELLQKLLQLSQLAPSSFNLQPYKIILVQDSVVKDALADTMLGGNGQRVRDAPVTEVFLSDRGNSMLLWLHPTLFLKTWKLKHCS